MNYFKFLNILLQIVNFELLDRLDFARNLLVSVDVVVVTAALDDDHGWIVEFREGSSAAAETSTERALPVNDAIRCVVTFEYEAVDDQSFIAHSRVEVHRLALHACNEWEKRIVNENSTKRDQSFE